MKAPYFPVRLLAALIVLASVSAPAADQQACASQANKTLDKVTIASAV